MQGLYLQETVTEDPVTKAQITSFTPIQAVDCISQFPNIKEFDTLHDALVGYQCPKIE